MTTPRRRRLFQLPRVGGGPLARRQPAGEDRVFVVHGQLTMTSDPASQWTVYPVRVLIVGVDNPDGSPTDWNGLAIRTPAPSREYIGQRGTAHRVVDPELPGADTVRITMDDGVTLWGWEAWWVPVVEAEG